MVSPWKSVYFCMYVVCDYSVNAPWRSVKLIRVYYVYTPSLFRVLLRTACTEDFKKKKSYQSVCSMRTLAGRIFVMS